jgi:hypothetical protein
MNTQKDSGSATHASLIELAPAFFPARVMTPTQVAAAVADGPDEVKSRAQGKWHLCGDVSNEMFAVLSAAIRSETAMRISAFSAPSGARYGVVTHQVHGFAHRFLLPLYESCVVDLFTALKGGEQLAFLLGRAGNSEALLLKPPQGSLSGFAPLFAMCGPLARGAVGEGIMELARVIEALALPQQIPTLRQGEPVVRVNVSAVMPARTLESLLIRAKEEA